MRLTDSDEPYGAMARNSRTRNQDKKIGHKAPKLKSKEYKKGFMPKANPRGGGGILKDNY